MIPKISVGKCWQLALSQSVGCVGHNGHNGHRLGQVQSASGAHVSVGARIDRLQRLQSLDSLDPSPIHGAQHTDLGAPQRAPRSNHCEQSFASYAPQQWCGGMVSCRAGVYSHPPVWLPISLLVTLCKKNCHWLWRVPTLTAKCGSQGRFRSPSCFLRFITAWSFESNEGCKQKGSRAAVLVLPASTIKQWTKKTIPKIIHTEMNSYQVYHICNRDRTKKTVNNTAIPEDFSTFRSVDKSKSSINREKINPRSHQLSSQGPGHGIFVQIICHDSLHTTRTHRQFLAPATLRNEWN